MDKKQFETLAVDIGEKMREFSDETGANFGFIFDQQEGFRVFTGGSIDIIIEGIAIGIAHLCADIGDKDGEMLNVIAKIALDRIGVWKGLKLQ